MRVASSVPLPGRSSRVAITPEPALQPQLLLGQDGQCLGDGQPGQAEAACMQRLLHPEAVTVNPLEAQLAQQDLLLGIGAR